MGVAGGEYRFLTFVYGQLRFLVFCGYGDCVDGYMSQLVAGGDC